MASESILHPIRQRVPNSAAALPCYGIALWIALFCAAVATPAEAAEIVLRGKITDPHAAVVKGAAVTLAGATGAARTTVSDEKGDFEFRQLAEGDYRLRAEWTGFEAVEMNLRLDGNAPPVELRFEKVAAAKSVVIVSTALSPGIDVRPTDTYSKTLFSRDDQLLETLAAGINAGQHEGGGKSLEIRRFGFNLDHGGTSGGLKIVVNDLPQNQASQAHGQGYLGALKTLTPELVGEVTILNGPFSAEYGDFSGLGVVQIRTRESLPDQLTWRMQGGSFNTYRTFFAYSPMRPKLDSLIAYEGSYTDGPFQSPLRYQRHNVTGNYTAHLDARQSLGFKFNGGTNDFYSSGQIPLDQVASGALDRFGYIDPSDGGRVRMGTFAAYYRREFASGDSLKIDGFLGRSLYDLYSNFTFHLNHPAYTGDPISSDAIQQHDSRLQEGVNVQYLHAYKIAGARALLTAGSNFHDNQINVALYPRSGRTPLGVTTRSYLTIPNVAGYAQQGLDLLNGRLHLEAGLRWDYFRWRDNDQVNPAVSGALSDNKLQPKAAVAYTPSQRLPLTLSFNYGRGINTQDARGIVSQPDSPRIATTDFYQTGAAVTFRRFALSADTFLIDRSHEQVYVPDDGTYEFKGPSRSYGYEGKFLVKLTSRVSLAGGLTQVTNAFYRGTVPRVYVDSAPHTVANASVTVSRWHGFFGTLRYRHTSHYRLDGLDPTILASGLDVLDLAVSKQLRPWVEFNVAIDNLTNKQYWETQNYFQSRLTPGAPAMYRVHGTPGYPVDLTVGLTFRLAAKAR